MSPCMFPLSSSLSESVCAKEKSNLSEENVSITLTNSFTHFSDDLREASVSDRRKYFIMTLACHFQPLHRQLLNYIWWIEMTGMSPFDCSPPSENCFL